MDVARVHALAGGVCVIFDVIQSRAKDAKGIGKRKQLIAPRQTWHPERGCVPRQRDQPQHVRKVG
jgi:hypothetical protein